MSNTPRRRKIQAHSHSKSLKDSLADLSKHKHLRGSVIEALGNTVSVRMNLNGSILHGIELVGGPVAVDDIVSVDYASSTPVAYAIGETITLPSIPKAFVPPITDSPLPISLSEFIYSIILYDASEFRTFEFPVSNDGMDNAIAAADTGDGITIPNSNVITTTIDIPAGVSLRGQSIDGTIISGKVTLGNGSHISNLSIEIDTSGSDLLIGVEGPTTGEAEISNVDIVINQGGSGDVYCVYLPSGDADLSFARAYLYADSVGGSGYCAYIHGSATGTVRGFFCALEATTGISNLETSQFQTYGCSMDTNLDHGVTMGGDLSAHDHTHDGYSGSDHSHSGSDYGADFVDLDDTPSSYSGEGGKILRVNSGETEVEFTAPAADLAGVISAYLAMPGLRAFYPMSSVDASGWAIDLSGQGRDLASGGTANMPEFARWSGGIVPMIYNYSPFGYLFRPDEAGFDISGTESYINSAAQGCTFGIWVYPLSHATNSRHFIGKFTGTAATSSYSIYMTTSGEFSVAWVDAAGPTMFYRTSGSGFADSNWYFLAARFDPNDHTALWVNDTKYQGSATNAALNNCATAFSIGARGDGTYPAEAFLSMGFVCATAILDDYIADLFKASRPIFGV